MIYKPCVSNKSELSQRNFDCSQDIKEVKILKWSNNCA